VKRPLFRKRLSRLVVGAVAVAAVLVPAGLADKPTTKPNDDKQKPVASEKSWVKLGGGRAYGTYLTFDAGFASALGGAKVTLLKPANDPKDTPDMGFRFPVTQGKLVVMVDAKTAAITGIKGTIGHVGGLKLVQGKKVVRVRNFVIVVDTPNVAKVTAQVNGKRIWFATLTSFNWPKVEGKKVTVDNVELTLSDKTATALNAAFGTALSASAKVGTATVQARLVGKGKTAS
jgi:hypothetical protein